MIKYFLDKPLLESVDLRFERKSEGASGYDLMANIGLPRVISCRRPELKAYDLGMLDGQPDNVEIGHGRRWMCPTGLYLSMPIGVEAQVRTRSGLARDHGIVVLNAPGTVDSDYRGEVMVCLINLGDQDYEVLPGDRIAQIVFCPVFAPSEFSHGGPGYILHPWGDYKNFRQPERVDTVAELGDTDRGGSGHGSTGR